MRSFWSLDVYRIPIPNLPLAGRGVSPRKAPPYKGRLLKGKRYAHPMFLVVFFWGGLRALNRTAPRKIKHSCSCWFCSCQKTDFQFCSLNFEQHLWYVTSLPVNVLPVVLASQHGFCLWVHWGIPSISANIYPTNIKITDKKKQNLLKENLAAHVESILLTSRLPNHFPSDSSWFISYKSLRKPMSLFMCICKKKIDPSPP